MQFKRKAEDQLHATNTMTMLGTRQSRQRWDAQRLSDHFETPEAKRHRYTTTPPATRRHGTSGLNECDAHAALRSWPSSRPINWSDCTRQAGMATGNRPNPEGVCHRKRIQHARAGAPGNAEAHQALLAAMTAVRRLHANPPFVTADPPRAGRARQQRLFGGWSAMLFGKHVPDSGRNLPDLLQPGS